MTLKRFLLSIIFILFAYLGLYTWNERSGVLDKLAENTGLEVVGYVLAPCKFVANKASFAWHHYVDLVSVREENDLLKGRLDNATSIISQLHEQSKELERLRELMNFSPAEGWSGIGARVIGTRIGPQAALESVLLDKGFLSGALPGTPVVTPKGVIGRILRSSPNFSTAILLSDPSCRIAVVSQETRFQGVLSGTGEKQPLEIHYVPPNANVRIGEYLVTSGLDGVFPKGIPVAFVESAKPSDTSPFQAITAWPLASADNIEEVLLLQPPVTRQEVVFNRLKEELPVPNPLGNGTDASSSPSPSLSVEGKQHSSSGANLHNQRGSAGAPLNQRQDNSGGDTSDMQPDMQPDGADSPSGSE